METLVMKTLQFNEKKTLRIATLQDKMYTGILVGYDMYHNISLTKAILNSGDFENKSIGNVLINGSNIAYIELLDKNTLNF